MVETATFRMFHRARLNPEPLPESDFFQESGGQDDTARLTENALPARFLQELRARQLARENVRESWPEPESAENPVSPAETSGRHFGGVLSQPASIEEPERPEISPVAPVPEPLASSVEPEVPLPELAAPFDTAEFDGSPEPPVSRVDHAAPVWEAERFLVSLDPEDAEPEGERSAPPLVHEEHSAQAPEPEHFLASLKPEEPEPGDERAEPLVVQEEHTASTPESEPVLASHDPDPATELPSQPWVPFADWHPAKTDDQQADWSPANDAQSDSLVEPVLAPASEVLLSAWDLVPEQESPALRQYYHSDPLALDYQLLGLANPIVCTVIGKLGDAAPIRLSTGRTGIYRPDGFRAAPWGGFAYDVSPDGRNGLVVGTRILTARGQIAVEDLTPGDTALALRGPALLPIIWIGRSTAAAPPVQIAANAFGPGRPSQTLCVGADHPIFMENMPVAARDLVNGSSVQSLDLDDVELFQIDVGFPEVLLAEGIPLASGVRWLS